jgi:predicted ATP-binding protein involved in virulence
MDQKQKNMVVITNHKNFKKAARSLSHKFLECDSRYILNRASLKINLHSRAIMSSRQIKKHINAEIKKHVG